MNENGNDKKLDWMYKSANSLVDREEYLLGRSVDKTLEQLNSEERDKKLGLVPPKNHVEHECIPPSIRDFNKIVQAEQVDISAKLQEDPLVAIKKREEEARRQFLQNPVQLKKLQEALKAQELKKKKKQKKSTDFYSDSDLDSNITKKLKYLKHDPIGLRVIKKHKKKSGDKVLDTILMHKFNQLKDKLSQEDLNDILNGNVSDSDENQEKKTKKHRKKKDSTSESSDYEQRKPRKKEKKVTIRSSSEKSKAAKKRKDYSSSSDSDSSDAKKNDRYKYNREAERKYRKTDREKSDEKYSSSKYQDRDRKGKSFEKSKKERHSSDDESVGKKRNHSDDSSQRKDGKNDTNRSKKDVNAIKKMDEPVNNADSDLESKILQKLRMLRDSAKSKTSESSSSDDSTSNDSESEYKKKKSEPQMSKEKQERKNKRKSSTSGDSEDSNPRKLVPHYDSDNDEHVYKARTFGLVKSDGTKIALNKNYEVRKGPKSSTKVETATKVERKEVKKLTEEEKEKLRREMMKNAEKRDKERSDNLRKYREEDKREESKAKHFDKDFVHKELLKTTKDATVETRIKSKLNNIQRSSRHMNSHFARRN